MARKRITTDDLPPAGQRKCVQIGVGRVNEKGSVTYNKRLLELLWFAWPFVDLHSFCRELDIPYQVASKNLSVSEKRHASSSNFRSFRERVRAEVSIQRVSTEEDAANRLRESLASIEEVAALGSVFARSKLGRVGSDGALVLNPSIPTKEVKACIELAHRCSEILKNVFDIREAKAPTDDGEDIVPKPVVPRKLRLTGSE